MRCLLEGWKVGRCVIVGMFLSNIPTVQLSAQVGHNPGTSPYHDIALHAGPMFFVGHLGADRGKVKSDLAQAEVGMLLRLTGGKTWHGFAPYVGTGLGLVFDTDSPGDTTGSRYRFGSKFTLAFASGVRWYPARRVVLNADVRAVFWRLKYPVSFHTPLASDGSRVIPLNERLTDWTVHPWITFGLGWTF